MDASPFSAILADLLRRVPGAFACALVDLEGETVDYAGLGDPFDVKIAAAHSRILLREIEVFGALGDPRWVTIRGEKRTVVARRLPEGYALVVLFRRRAGFGALTSWHRAFAACERALSAEAGWACDVASSWHPVAVETDARGRPRRVGAPAVDVEVLGAVMGLASGERGYRVRLANGVELTVVREPGSGWYADDFVATSAPVSAG